MGKPHHKLTRKDPRRMDWRDARTRMEHEQFLFLRRLRHANGPSSDLWDLTEEDLRERARQYAIESCRDGIARWNADH